MYLSDVMPAQGAASSTPRPIDLSTAVSGILDRPLSRAMTASAPRHPEVLAQRASKGDGPARATGPFILRGLPSGAIAPQGSHLRMTG